jgi:hypothetical protein
MMAMQTQQFPQHVANTEHNNTIQNATQTQENVATLSKYAHKD